MKRFPMFGVVALLGVVVSVPAQGSTQSRFGRFLHGAVSVARASHAMHCPPVVHVAPAPACHPAPRCQPIPRCQPAPRGHWETVREQVLVPGYWQEQHVPPTYGWITDRCGHRHWGIIDAGGCRQVWVPARWETRCRQVWVSC